MVLKGTEKKITNVDLMNIVGIVRSRTQTMELVSLASSVSISKFWL
jgi:uncharacterized alpha/beta hydrolase family protein